MKVNDNNAELFDYSKKLDGQLREQKAKKEAEIEKIKKIYSDRIAATKIEGEDQYLHALKRNDDILIGASQDFEEKLKNYQNRLEKTQKGIEAHENIIKTDHADKMANLKLQFKNNLQDQFESAHEAQDAVGAQTQERLLSIGDKARAERNHLEKSTHNQFSSMASNYNQKGLSQENQYRTELENNLRSHQNELALQRDELNKTLEKNAQENKRLEAEKIRVQTDELNFLDKHQKEMIAQKQNDFKVRYESLVKEHDSILTRLKEAFHADVKKMAEDSSDQKRVIANRIDDQFYRVETLNPKVVDLEKELLVTLAVPEHEKENVHVSVNGRTVKLTLTRKFNDSINEKDGSLSRSSRSELFSKEIQCKDILNSKLVAQKYVDGVLSYKISKL